MGSRIDASPFFFERYNMFDMRKIVFLFVAFSLFPLFSFAQDAGTGYTVTYSKDGDKICPANAVMIVGKCYCASGYKVSGASCVKDVPAPVAQNEIYQDIRTAVGFNGEMTCTQLGFTGSPDIEMCQKYRTASSADRATWKSIPRPSVSGPAITNPWAPAGQQTLINVNASSTVPAVAAPEPEKKSTSTAAVATEPIATSTPAPIPEPVMREMPPPKKLEDLQPIKEIEQPTPIEQPVPEFVAASAAQAASVAATQEETIATTTNDAIDMASVMAGLSLIPSTDSAPASTAENDTTLASPSIFQRIKEWFFGLF